MKRPIASEIDLQGSIEPPRLAGVSIQPLIFLLFLVIGGLDLFANFGRRTRLLTETQGQTLHVCVYVALATSAFALVRRLQFLPRSTWVVALGLTMIVAGESLDLIRSFDRFRGIPFVASDGPYGDLLNRCLHTLGMCLFMAGFYLVLIDLNSAEGKLRYILYNMPVMLDAVDEKGTFVAWNRESEKVTGYASREVVGNPGAMELLYPADGPCRFPSGKPIPEDYRDWECAIRTRTGELRTISWSSQSRSFPIAGWAAWGIGIDVTQARNLERELLRIERSDAMGKLVSGINRRIEALLGPMRPKFEMLKRSADADTAQWAAESLQRFAEVHEMMRRLSTLSKTARHHHRPIDLRPLIEDATSRVRDTLANGSAVEVRMALPSEKLPGAIPPEDFERAFVDLLRNAIEFAREPGASRPLVEIATSQVVETGRPPGRLISSGSTHRQRPTTVITIRDYGPGIPEDILDRVFEPFATTRPGGNHAGLGLVVAQSLILRNRGRLELSNNPEGGCTAKMVIPSESAAVPPSP